MKLLKRIAVAGAMTVAVMGAAAGVATADTVGDTAPHSTAPVVGLINGDVQALDNVHVLDRSCVAPWHWDGPIQALTDAAPYQACQVEGGVQTDAPAVDLSQHPLPLPLS